MTGFGRGEAAAEGFEATVELKSVNNRFCEVSVRAPRILADREAEIQKIVKGTFARGRFTLQVQLESASGEESRLQIDSDAARTYRKLLEDLRSVAGIEEPVTLDHLLRYSDVLKPAEEAPGREDIAWRVVRMALEGACNSMMDMRLREGQGLETELLERLGGIEAGLETVELEAPKRLPAARERLNDRLAEILADSRIDRDRLEFEMAMLADRLDVREECVRLRVHIEHFREAIAEDRPVGRKLNFLMQEMNREVNTIGSKANDAGLSTTVVAMKEDLEKIREQVENVE